MPRRHHDKQPLVSDPKQPLVSDPKQTLVSDAEVPSVSDAKQQLMLAKASLHACALWLPFNI